MGGMPGDPKEARVHAANCMQLAATANSPTLQKTFADLAKQWNKLANELDDAHALLKALNELDLKEATTSDGDLSSLEKAKASQQAPRIRLPWRTFHWQRKVKHVGNFVAVLAALFGVLAIAAAAYLVFHFFG
jgi:hypothetical protein